MNPAPAILLLAAVLLAACNPAPAPPASAAPPAALAAPAPPGVPVVTAPPARPLPVTAGAYTGLCIHPDRDGPGQPAGAFRDFIATRPTPQALRQRFPDLRIVLPGQPSTMEFRRDCRRFFATLDGEGRVTGGRFN